MSHEEFTSREKALLHAWDVSNTPPADGSAFRARLLAAYDAEVKSPQAFDAQDDEICMMMAAEAFLEDAASIVQGATFEPPQPVRPESGAPPGHAGPTLPLTHLKLRPSPEWPRIIDDVLGDDARAYQIARSTMWVEVGFYVERVARLPIGPLNDDDEARRDIGVHVLRKLEANSCQHLREWRARQRKQQDHASWWGWIKLVSRRVSIDYARTSRQNIARRGEPFECVRVDAVDPFVLGKKLGGSLDVLAQRNRRELHEFLIDWQASHARAGAI